MAPMLAADNNIGSVSVGDGGMNKLFQTYFNGRNTTAFNLGAGRNDTKTHFVLADSERVFEDAGTVIRNINMDHLLWINQRDFMPARVTDKIEHELTVIKFDDPVAPEQTPAEAVSRYFDIGKEKMSFRSKRYGISMYFELDRMLTAEGKNDFAMFTRKISIVFRIHAAYIALVRFMAQSNEDRAWYAEYGGTMQVLKTEHIRREVEEWAETTKYDTGAFAMIWRYGKAMQLQNGAPPTHVIFNSEKQGLFKFGNKLLSEYYRAGADGPDRVLGFDEIANVQGMSFRGWPAFPDKVANKGMGNRQSMLNAEREIGNYFQFRKAYINLPADQFKSGVHDYLDAFSENKDNFHRYYEREMNAHCGRWDERGNLHKDHGFLLKPDVDANGGLVDQYVYNVARYIGDMEPKYLDRHLLRSMVRSALVGFDVENARNALMDVLGGADSNEAVNFMAKLTRHLSERLGGKKNPVFDSRRIPKVKGGVAPLSSLDHAMMVFMENCVLINTGGHGKIHDTNAVDIDHPLRKDGPMVAADQAEEYWTDFRKKIGDLQEMDVDEAHVQACLTLMHHLQEIFMRGLLKHSADTRGLGGVQNATLVALNDVFSTILWAFARVKVKLEDKTTLEAVMALNRVIEELGLRAMYTAEIIEALENKSLEALYGPLKTMLEASGVNQEAIDKELKKPKTGAGFKTNVDEAAPAHVQAQARGETFKYIGPTRMVTTQGLGAIQFAQFLADREVTGISAPFQFLNADPIPFRDDKFPDASGEDNDYNIKRGKFNEDTNTFIYGDTSMGANATYVVDTYQDIIERATALAILSTPINREVFDTMISYNVPIPTEYLLVRPHMRYMMSALVLAQGGKQMGETLVGYGHTAVGWKTINKTGDLHSTQWIGAAMWNYRRRCIIRNAFYEAYLGGAGHMLFTEKQVQEHIRRGFRSWGLNMPCVMVMSIGYGSVIRDNSINLPGTQWPNEAPHYDSYQYYGNHYGFFHIPNASCSLIMDEGAPRRNTICFQGTQRQCATLNGDPGDITENTGHHGIERPGDAKVRARGMMVKSH